MRTGLLLLLLVLCGGNPPGLTAERVYIATEGGTITVRCLMFEHGPLLIFCRNDCKGRDILVQALPPKTQNVRDRYSLQYFKNELPPHLMEVSITDVVKSDSGAYRCVTGSEGKIEHEVHFHINVTSAATSSDPDASLRPVTYTVYEDISTFTTAATRKTTNSSGPSGLLWLLLIPVAVVMTSVFGFLLYRKKRTQRNQENTDRSRTETELYENVGPQSAEDVYQNLNVDTMDQDQTYSTI